MKIHIVQKGDTLWKIAKKYGVNFEELKKLNSQLSNPDMIMPGMKIKVPTTGGTIKKEGPVSHLGVKKEFPLKEQPIKEMPVPKKEVPIKEVPIKEVPVKEVPIAKEQPVVEAPKVPYTPKMPLQIIPEIDVNNYYMMNMQNVKVEQPQVPPKANILPEVKEEVKKEVPVKMPVLPPVPPKEAPVQMQPAKEMPIQTPPPMEAPMVMPQQQDYCVPVTPILPGSGFCPPFGGFPVQPYMPYHPGAGMDGFPGMGAMPGYMPPVPAGPAFIPQHFEDESSFIPPVPGFNPGGAVMGAQTGFQQPMGMDPGFYGQTPAGFGHMPMSEGQMPMGYGQMPMGQGQMPMGPGQMPMGYGQMPMGQGQMPMGYGQMPMGPGQMPMGFGQMPMSEGQMPMGPGQMPMGYGQMPMGPGQMPMGYGQMPMSEGQMPMGQGQMPMGYGQMPMQQMSEFTGQPAGGPIGTYPAGTPSATDPSLVNPGLNPYGTGPSYGYPQMVGPRPQGFGMTAPDMTIGSQMAYMPELNPPTISGGDCGCGGGTPVQQNFVPPTPPIYSAPYNVPMGAAQPPFMNPYGMGPVGQGVQGYHDESSS
ncbi:SafA/ExsA family spore coat assembly protein [Neobacillus sp. Marseille-QA0830]